MSDIEREATEEMLSEGVESLTRGLKKFPDNYTQIVSNIWEDMQAARQAPASGEVEPVEIISDIRHSADVDNYTASQRRFLWSIADRLEKAFAHPPAKVPEEVSKRLEAWSRALTGWPKGTVIEKVKSQIDKLLTTPTPATTPEQNSDSVRGVLRCQKCGNLEPFHATGCAQPYGEFTATTPEAEWVIRLRGEYLATRGIWERPDHRGYTNDLHEAGRYSQEEAEKAEAMAPHKYKAVCLAAAPLQEQ